MMRKRGIGIFFLIILLAMPMVFAISTQVTIKTMPYREVQIGASKSSGESLQFFSNKSDEYGDISFTLEFEVLKYNLFVFIKEEETTVATKREYDLVSGEPVYLEVATSGFEFYKTPAPESKTNLNNSITNNTGTSNETVNSNETLIKSEESESKISSIAGAAITKIKENKIILIYIFVGIILIAGIFMFFHKRKGRSDKEEKEIRVTKLSDKLAENSKRQAILDMEGKIRQLQDELGKLSG